MRKLEKDMVDELKSAKKLLDTVQKEKRKLNVKEGDKVAVSSNRRNCSYFLGTHGDGRGKYVTMDEMDYAKQVMQNEYYEKVENKLKRIVWNLERGIKDCSVLGVKDIYNKMPKGRQKMVTPIIETDEEYIARWMEEHPGGKNGYPFKTQYDTDRSEIVRTKSEKILADFFLKLKIPYQYEPELLLDNGIVKYPDFVLLNVRERKTYWLEHFGLTGDINYIHDNIEKIMLYERNGIVVGENLIVTMETDTYPLDVKMLERTVRKYLL